MASIPDNRKLPKREADLFKSILKLYERKEYKKGLKAAEAVLKKFPTHGETLAMKGLTLNALGKKEEAHDHVRRGLRADLRSHVCWHVYGLLHRSERNYAEAIKSYLNALKHEPENLQILKDLAALQIQIREVKGFVETRRKLLGLKSNLQQNWTAYAVANHVAGNAETTVQAIDAFVKTLKGDRYQRADERYPHSELLLYKNLALSDAGMTQEALDHLEECSDKVMDKLGWTKKKGELLLALGRHEDAEKIYRELLDRGDEDYTFHRGLQCAVLKLPPKQCEEALKLRACELPSGALRAAGKLGEAEVETLTKLYRGLRERFEGSPAAARIPLTFLEGEELRSSLDAYMRRYLRKGVPSLGTDLSSVFEKQGAPTSVAAGGDADGGEEKLGRPSPVVTDAFDLRNHPVQQMVMDLTKSFVESLRSTGRFPTAEGEKDGDKEPEETLAWTLFLRAQLEERTGFLQEAYDTLEECAALQPTMLDFLQRKGRVLRKMGALTRAAEAVDSARMLDKADRYMNSKATKYLLRAGQIPKAEQTIAIFTRHEGDPQHNLFEMQCSWFELEWAEAQIRAGKPGLAMKKALAVHTHFEDFVEDQFDFHTYCMRKVTLRSYLGMLRMVDDLRSQKSYRRASALLVRAYLRLHDERPGSAGGGGAAGLPDMTNMTAAEKKRVKAKARRDAKKKAAEQELEKQQMLDEAARQSALAKETANGSSKTDDGGGGGEKKGGHNKRRGRAAAAPPVDPDPLGLTLLEKDPLPEAARLVALLSAHAGAYVETHLLAFDVAMRRGKYLLAARAVIRGRALEPRNPELLLRTIQLYHEAQATPPSPGQPAASCAPADGSSTPSPTTGPAPPSPLVARVLAEEAEGLLGTGGLAGAVAELVRLAEDAETGSLGARVCAAKALSLTAAEQGREQAVRIVREGLDGRGVTVPGCANAVEAVRGVVGEDGSAAVEALREVCGNTFPNAEVFKSSSAQEVVASSG
ncbi:acetyltransferase 1-like [Ectocarpus siliculosus]|uniref:Acetyltransferase 1-like n=1 Tax=Ectocarpus siliculosus TaxID=2880 RepID=D8LSU9_ECTSI|nr:acetyltransferase 1-like [Ectocarpus siliculosus]|eukprot:CBN77876.1 acetyltransferase 1-like [Ectocarpus siliculosus]